METLGIIPARYASTRFPGKPLADIFGKPMIQHVYEKASTTLAHVVVATDDERIQKIVIKFGGNVVLTNANHESGTDRCAEALNIFEKESELQFDAVINIQGDEPFIDPEQIKQLNTILEDSSTELVTLIKPIENLKNLLNPNKVKVVIGNAGQALYFSRYAIPYYRGLDEKEALSKHAYYQHIGMYGYKKEILNKITRLSKGSLEICESLEQLRWLENGYKITTAITNIESIGIDTPEDLEKIIKKS